ncbi:response regulator [Paenibacillus sp. TRM 82003]|nr:response regulator [Paenibacillus sp. TRM 82003]
MYKVLLVDDERMIIENISKVMQWASYGTELAGTARNGVEAFDFIQEELPDIVITDIRMPGMDGIELIAKVRELELPVNFIMLSGFGEFDYARSAMQYGVKHYLLKPCSEGMIGEALAEIVAEMDRRRNKDEFFERIQAEYRKMIPHVKEQVLKEFVMNKTYGRSDWERYRGLFGFPVEQERVRLALFQAEGAYEFEHLFALKNIAEEILGSDTLLLSTTVGPHVLLLLRDGGGEGTLLGDIETVKDIFSGFYRMDTTIALSEPGEIANARSMYRETLACLNHRFYLGEGSLITKQDIAAGEDNGKEIDFDEDRLSLLIKSGRWDDVSESIDEFFGKLTSLRLQAELAQSYVVTLFMVVVRQDPSNMALHLGELSKIGGDKTLQGMKDILVETARGITTRNYESNKRKHSSIVQKVLEIIEGNLGNPSLTLNSVAGEMLYMNADYLGKLFKKEVGDKFSNFVTKARMEKAIELIAQADDVKVFELAERLGFGDNPQYFSKVFKKYTGFTPSEFKRAP